VTQQSCKICATAACKDPVEPEPAFVLSDEIKKVMVSAGVSESEADVLIQSLGASVPVLQDLVMPPGAASPDMSKLLDDAAFSAAVTDAGIDTAALNSAIEAYSFEEEAGNTAWNSGSDCALYQRHSLRRLIASGLVIAACAGSVFP
jgi:hypothetical protein